MAISPIDHPIMESQGSSSSNYQEQFQQPSDEKLLLSLKEEIKRDNEALEMKLPIIESKMDANMIANWHQFKKYQ